MSDFSKAFPSLSGMVTGALLRNGTGIAATVIATYAHIQHNDAQAIVGAVVSLGTVAWSIYQKYSVHSAHNA